MGSPEKYAFILNPGFDTSGDRSCTYSKDEFNKVSVNLGLSISAGTIKSGAQLKSVTTLPVGFRPENRHDFIALYRISTGIYGKYAWGYGFVLSDGDIRIGMFAGQTDFDNLAVFVDAQIQFDAA